MKTPAISNLFAVLLPLAFAAHSQTSRGTVTGTVLARRVRRLCALV